MVGRCHNSRHERRETSRPTNARAAFQGSEEGFGVADRRRVDRIGGDRAGVFADRRIGPGAAESGYQLPIVFIIAVIPMYFVALAYKHLTDAAPDAGTVFTWGSKAIAPRVGWVGGYALLLSSVLAGVGRPASPSTRSLWGLAYRTRRMH